MVGTDFTLSNMACKINPILLPSLLGKRLIGGVGLAWCSSHLQFSVGIGKHLNLIDSLISAKHIIEINFLVQNWIYQQDYFNYSNTYLASINLTFLYYTVQVLLKSIKIYFKS